jgi:hypothetical protein
VAIKKIVVGNDDDSDDSPKPLLERIAAQGRGIALLRGTPTSNAPAVRGRGIRGIISHSTAAQPGQQQVQPTMAQRLSAQRCLQTLHGMPEDDSGDNSEESEESGEEQPISSSSEYSSSDSEDDDNNSASPNEEIFQGISAVPNTDIIRSGNGEEWKTTPPFHGGRYEQGNVLRRAPGITVAGLSRISKEDSIVTSFQALFDQKMVDTIVKESNREGRRVLGEEWSAINMDEMWAFIGLLLCRGVYRAAGESTNELWSPQHGRAVFSATMSYNRFRTIRRVLRFDNKETRNARLRSDKLAAVRLLLDSFVENSQACYFPSASVTVDEQLYPYRGRCAYRQYIPSKPSKYGLKFWLLSDSENYYCHNIDMYTGKTDDDSDGAPVAYKVVMKLSQPLWKSGRNITTDNFFTSLLLARSLKEKGLTLVGTMRKNRKEIPEQLKSHKKRELYSSQFVFNVKDGTCLVSYKAKKNRIVILLSSQHRDTAIAHNIKKKPDIITYYNSTKGGVDATDERVGTYSVKFSARRWHVVIFCNILDLSAFNGFVLHSLTVPEWNAKKTHRRRLYLTELGHALGNRYRMQRSVARCLHPATQAAMSRLNDANPITDAAEKNGAKGNITMPTEPCSIKIKLYLLLQEDVICALGRRTEKYDRNAQRVAIMFVTNIQKSNALLVCDACVQLNADDLFYITCIYCQLIKKYMINKNG